MAVIKRGQVSERRRDSLETEAAGVQMFFRFKHLTNSRFGTTFA